MGDLGAQRRDQDPGRHRRRPGLHRGQGAVLGRRRPGAELPASSQVAALLRGAAKSLDSGQQVEDRLEVVLADDVRAAMGTYGPRELVSPTPDYPIYVDRRAALFSSWYEFFPRSQGAEYDEETETWKSGTFDSSHERLEAAAAMGFDVVYVPPIHPIGYEFRKGANNTLTPGPGDPGSPWAIGSKEGGHDAIHPDLGDFEAFDRFVAKAKSLGLEIAHGLRPAGRPRPSVGDRASGMVLPPGRRFDRVRGEPAEEVPGHLSDQLRHRPGRHLRREPAHPEAVDEPRRPHLPGRQPAHQAGQLLGLAASARSAGPTRTSSSWPRPSPSRP